MQKKVFVVGNPLLYKQMFETEGWVTQTKMCGANLVQFTGGQDVSPGLYGQLPHKETTFNAARDQREMVLYKLAISAGIPVAGICRGGQFINVMNRGKLYQHTDGHQLTGTHPATDSETGKIHNVTSTHHQLMIPGPNALIIMTAHEAKHRQTVGPVGSNHIVYNKREPDIEALYYEKTNAFCFQPHPEVAGFKNLRELYMFYLDKYLFSLKELA